MKLLQHHNQSDLPIRRKQVQLLVEEFFSFVYGEKFKTRLIPMPTQKVADYRIANRIEPSFPSNDVVVHFVSKEEISDLHGTFFQDPTPTDCITFPFRDEHLLGEIFLCPQMAIDYFPDNPHKETTLYLIHALLHLLGYDDIDPVDKEQMRNAESLVMNHLSENHLLLSV